MYNQLCLVEQKLANIQTDLQEVFSKQVVLTVGLTGVGKSTLMNAILQGSDQMEYNED